MENLNICMKMTKKFFLNIDRASFRDCNSKKNVIAIRDITEYKKITAKIKVK